MANALNWFEIPAKNFARAKSFYETVLGISIDEMPHPSLKYGMFPAAYESGEVGGGLVEGEGFEPSDKGSVIYLNGGDDLAVPLSRVEKAGGKVVLPKTSIGANGFMAHIIDTEGNRIALHSMK
jgi:predicted enzyme related to lactoylglutathione lyase